MTPRLVLGLLAALYVTLVTAASGSAGPRSWGFHLAGFVEGPARTLVVGLLALGAGLLLWSARPDRHGRPGWTPAWAGRLARPGLPRLPAWAALLLLPPVAVLLHVLRARTHLLGDGQIWIDNLVSGSLPAFSEPLSTAIWNAYASLLRGMGASITAPTLAWLPAALGAVAAVLLFLLARELAPAPRTRGVTLALLAGLGTSQLYFGYIESYPVASVAILAYLLALQRAARGAAPAWIAAALLAVAIAAHLIAVILAPSLLSLLWRGRSPLPRRLLAAAIAVGGAFGLCYALGFGWDEVLRPFRHAAGAAEAASSGFRFGVADLVSARRVSDLANLALLIAPVPLLLLLARLSGWRAGPTGETVPLSALSWAAASGILTAALLVLPGSPAQDWDLMAITVLPAAVLAVALAQPLLAVLPATGRIGLCLLSAGTLLSFVLVNADEAAGVRRFTALVGEDSRLSAHERAYGNEKLVQYHASRGEFEPALRYSERMVRAEPTNPRYWVKAGATLCNLGRYLEAAPYFEEALRRAPGRADATYNLGLCYARTQRIPEAIAAFRAAVAADGSQPDYRHNLGVVLFSAGNADSARAVWEDVLRRWPGYPLTVRAWERRFGSPPPNR